MSMACVRFIVTGRVQGVCFRASTRARAVTWGITGYAKNRADGSVEVVASGGADALDRLEAWLHHGPPAADVSRVVRASIADQALRGFLTL